MAGKLHS